MRSTKSEILSLLKRNDGATVDELVSSLHLAPMTVRQHLTALERDLLVQAHEVRRQTGRPHFRYSLTADGHRRLSEGCDRMLALLVEQAGFVDGRDAAAASPDERRRQLFRRAAEALAERHRHEVAVALPEAAADHVVTLLRSYGGFPEWSLVDGYIEVRDFGCVYRASVASEGICVWHETFLSHMINGDVWAAEAPAGCADCCRFALRISQPANRGNPA